MTGERSEYTGRPIVDVVDEIDLLDAQGVRIGRVLELSPDVMVVQPDDGSAPFRVPTSQTREAADGRDLALLPGYDLAGGRTAIADTATGVATGADETIRVAVHEEELHARKRIAITGEVEVRKRVVEEERTITVPVLREELEIVRRPVGAAGAHADADAYGATAEPLQAGATETFRIVLREEVVEVVKTPRVVEEVELIRTVGRDMRQVTDTVRREEVEVVEEGRIAR